MKVQYIYNENGEKENVIISYKEWTRICSTMKVDNNKDFDPDKYKGIYKNLGLNLEKEIKNLRDEWTRLDI